MNNFYMNNFKFFWVLKSQLITLYQDAIRSISNHFKEIKKLFTKLLLWFNIRKLDII